jgi:hypothetical protein
METVPEELSPNLQAYFTRVLKKIDTLEANPVPEMRTSIPIRPIVGRLYYFKNTSLPTITAEGLWIYKSNPLVPGSYIWVLVA